MSSNKRPLVLVLGIVGALFIILGIVYLAIPAGSLPSLLGATHPKHGHHTVRMATSFVIGIVCLVAAWYVNKSSKSASQDQNSTYSGAAS